MENMKTFESWLLKEKHDDIVKNIIDYVKRNNTIAQYLGNDFYRFFIHDKMESKSDPFGEEVLENKLKVDVRRGISPDVWTNYSYSIYLDDDELECSSYLPKKLYYLIINNIANIANIERENRIKEKINKIDFLKSKNKYK